MKITKQEISKRWQKYQAIIQSKKLDVLLLTSPASLFYTTNYPTRFPSSREGLVVMTHTSIILIVPGMYQAQTRSVFHGVTIKVVSQNFWQTILTYMEHKKVGFEAGDIIFSEYAFLKKHVKKMIPLSKELQTIYIGKSSYEIEKIRQAEYITEEALRKVLPNVVLGQSEREIVKRLDETMETLGADAPAFPTIVAFGNNSAVPHHLSSSVTLQENDVVLIDMGAKKDGYCGDLTRTLVYGKPHKDFITAYNLVLTAQQKAIDVIKPGVEIKKVDEIVRMYFENKKQLSYFLHTTGHGLGIEVHEAPSLSYMAEGMLEPGMIITIEPGLYYDSWGGVRIEDVVVVTQNGCEVISHVPKTWNVTQW